MFLQIFHPSLEKPAPPGSVSGLLLLAIDRGSWELAVATHLLIVSESPHTQRCRLGRVMATGQSVGYLRSVRLDTHRLTVVSRPGTLLRAPCCCGPD